MIGEVDEISPVPGVLEMQVIPSFWLQLFQQDAVESSSTVVRFETDNIETIHILASGMGIKVTPIETVPDAVRHVEFLDPFGNLLSFYEQLS